MMMRRITSPIPASEIRCTSRQLIWNGNYGRQYYYGSNTTSRQYSLQYVCMYVCMYDPPARTRRLTLTCLKKKQQPPTASPLSLSLSHLPHAMQLTTQPPHHHHYNQDHYHIIKSSITESDTSCQYTYVGDSVVSPFLIFFL